MNFKINKIILFWFLMVTLWMIPQTLRAESIYSVQDAQSAVDHAWEVYHHAALSGTLASPQIQTQIEKDLHQARQLLIDLRDRTKTVPLIELKTEFHQIEQLTQKIVRSSRRAKQ